MYATHKETCYKDFKDLAKIVKPDLVEVPMDVTSALGLYRELLRLIDENLN